MTIWSDFAINKKIRQILDVTPRPENHHFGRPFITMWVRNIRFLFVALMLYLVSPPALAQTEPRAQLDNGPLETVKKLFRYSQFAERLSAQKNEPTNCPPLVPLKPSRQPIEIPTQWSAEKLDPDVRKVVSKQTGKKTFVEPPPNDEEKNTLYLGCRDSISGFDVAVEVRFYRRDTGADFVQLNVAGRRSDGVNTHWVAEKDGIILFPGTDLSQSKQIMANFVGQDCTFPIAKFTLYAICEQANKEGADSWLRTKNGKLTLVGHSLGGAAAQFIATSWPSPVNDQSWANCPGFSTFVFGSTGLESLDDSHQPAVQGALTSYASGCDWVAQSSLFYRRVQTGRLITLSPTTSHGIDSIQDDFCQCLRGVKHLEFGDYGSPDSPLANERLCAPAPGGA